VVCPVLRACLGWCQRLRPLTDRQRVPPPASVRPALCSIATSRASPGEQAAREAVRALCAPPPGERAAAGFVLCDCTHGSRTLPHTPAAVTGASLPSPMFTAQAAQLLLIPQGPGGRRRLRRLPSRSEAELLRVQVRARRVTLAPVVVPLLEQAVGTPGQAAGARAAAAPASRNVACEHVQHVCLRENSAAGRT
jgi:hypothetical protein